MLVKSFRSAPRGDRPREPRGSEQKRKPGKWRLLAVERRDTGLAAPPVEAEEKAHACHVADDPPIVWSFLMISLDVDALASAVAAKVVDLLRAGTFSDLMDQSQSPLGRRRHISLARSRPDRCMQVGRRYLVPKDLIDSEMATKALPKPARTVKTHETADLEAARTLGI